MLNKNKNTLVSSKLPDIFLSLKTRQSILARFYDAYPEIQQTPSIEKMTKQRYF
jgi:hypothetical protein